MPLFVRVLAIALILVAVTAGAFFLANRLLRPFSTYLVVDETTLVVLGRTMEVQHADGTTTVEAGYLTLHPSDRVRTGPDSYGAITHVDGSTTTLDPRTEVVLRRLDMGPSGVGNISLQLQRGAIWNRMERLVDTSTNFEVTTEAAAILARGSNFRVQVDESGRTQVESVLDSVEIEAAGGMVTVEPGFQTIIDPGRAPSPPIESPIRRFALRIDVQGPVRPFLTDAQHRSMGFHPDADVFISQISGATYGTSGNSAAGENRDLDIPEPSESYHVVLKGQGQGGPYTVSAATFADGRLVAGAGGLTQTNGTIGGGSVQGIDLQVRRPDVQFRGNPDNESGAPADSRAAVVQRQLRTSARAVETAAVLAIPTATATPTATVTPTLFTPSPTATATPSGPTPDLRAPALTVGPAATVAAPTTAAPTRVSEQTVNPTSSPSPVAPAGITVIATIGPPSPTAALATVTLPEATVAVPAIATAAPTPIIVTAVLPTLAIITVVPPTVIILTVVPPTQLPAATPRPTVALPFQAPVTSLPIAPALTAAALATTELSRP